MIQQTKLLGAVVSSDLKWQDHVDYVCANGFQRLYCLRMLKRPGVEPKDTVRIYVSLVRRYSHTHARSGTPRNCCRLLGHTGLTVQNSDRLEALRRQALRIAYPGNSYRESLLLTALDTLHRRRTALARPFFADMLRPPYRLHHLIPLQRAHRYNLRSSRLNDSIINTGRFGSLLIGYGLAVNKADDMLSISVESYKDCT